MDAFISGMDGVALCVDNGTFYRMRIEEQDVVTTCDISLITFQLCLRDMRSSPGVRSCTSLSMERIRGILEHDWAVDRATRLTRMANDPDEDAEIRRDAKDALDELLAKDKTISVQI